MDTLLGSLYVITIIAVVTEVVRRYVPQVYGIVTIAVAVLVGLLLGIADSYVGFPVDNSPAWGAWLGLSTSGIIVLLAKIGTGTPKEYSR